MPGQKATEATRREQILKAAYEVALRRGIDGLTVRAVAARARLSHGRVLATTLALRIPDEIDTISKPRERLQALLGHEVHRLLEDPRRIRLLLEYWARGAHNVVIRGKIGAGLDDYRAAFRKIAEEALSPKAGRSGTPAGVAAVAVSLIIGYPVQAMIDPDQFDIEEYLAAAQAIIGDFPMAA
jgi:AcrR family transcriptional regulator